MNYQQDVWWQEIQSKFAALAADVYRTDDCYVVTRADGEKREISIELGQRLFPIAEVRWKT